MKGISNPGTENSAKPMEVYLDNAATTPLDPLVLETMMPYLTDNYGNPSSTHAVGRKARAAIENARKKIASLIGATSSEIIFTAGGTHADNIFLKGSVPYIEHIITSPLEHPAVLNTVKSINKIPGIKITLLNINADGRLSEDELDEVMQQHPGSLVALMHGNNEIGNLLPIESISALADKHKARFFTDAVQTIGHYSYDLAHSSITGLAASAHKFHGPKGTGFLYLRKGTKLESVYKGGEQERGLNAGTENVAAIVGMARALELCYAQLDEDRNHITKLKVALRERLLDKIADIQFNGTSGSEKDSIYTILSASFPVQEQNDMLLFNLDLAGISVSAGSACASGASTESHVLKAIGHDVERATVRFSFSRNNTIKDVDYVLDVIGKLYYQA